LLDAYFKLGMGKVRSILKKKGLIKSFLCSTFDIRKKGDKINSKGSFFKKRYFLFLWELPQLFLAMIIYFFVKKNIVLRQEYKDAKVFLTRNFPGGISLSFIIFIDERYSGDLNLLKHEYGHSLQSIFLGWLYLFIVGIPSIIRAAVWRKYKLEDRKYYSGYPENWANRLGGVKFF
jgi:membrane-bound acyltransferase YfiQ involved in biofilm formation